MNPTWQIVRYRNGLDFAALDCHAVEELPTATGPADYGLFVVNDLRHTSHADQFERICCEVFNQGDDFVKKITGNPNGDRTHSSLCASTGGRARVRCRFGIRPSCRIRQFRNRPNLKVVVTVDMLSTGVERPRCSLSASTGEGAMVIWNSSNLLNSRIPQ